MPTAVIFILLKTNDRNDAVEYEPFAMPSGEKVKLLNDKNIYLGAQIEFADLGICYGVVADTGFILICSYSVNGSEPELTVYQKR